MYRSKTFKTLLILAAILVVVFSWILIRDARRNRIENSPQYNGLDNPFGFDENDIDPPGSGRDPLDSSGSDNQTENPGVPQQPGGSIVVIEANSPLTKLSDSAVAGFTFVWEERIIEKPDSTTPATGIVETYDFSGYKTIRFGDVADEIIAIKTVLNRQTPSPSLIIRTDYDTDMKNAVIDFQNRNGLSGDGVIGPKTYLKLNSFQGIATFTPVKEKDDIERVEMARYVDATGGIMIDKAIRLSEEKKVITKTSIPGVAEAYFDATGTRAVLRYFKDSIIYTYLVTLDFPEIDKDLTKEERDAMDKTAKVTGEFMPENIRGVGVSRDRSSFFYLNPVSGGVAGITYNFSTKAKKQVFDSMLTEWIVDWGATSKISLTTKASGLVPGYSYSADTKTGALSKNIGGKKGLTTLLAPDGKKLLYSESNEGSVSMFILELSTGKTTAVSPSTLPEKCVWTKDSTKLYCAAPVKTVSMLYPDDWYKGKQSFDDALWVVDASDYSGNIIYDIFSKKGEKIDITNLSLNAEENYLGFINKKDGILWGFDLNK